MTRYKVFYAENDAIETEAPDVNSAVWDWLNSDGNVDVRQELVGECTNGFEVSVDDGTTVTVYRGQTEMVLHLEVKNMTPLATLEES